MLEAVKAETAVAMALAAARSSRAYRSKMAAKSAQVEVVRRLGAA